LNRITSAELDYLFFLLVCLPAFMSLLYNDYVKNSAKKIVCIVFMMLAHLTLES
jgi:hypothetical protein